MENITDINQIKMAVLIKTAQYAFEGTLDEKQENIPYELTDPIKPNFRCCVYREREIIRQREDGWWKSSLKGIEPPFELIDPIKSIRYPPL